MIANSSHSFTNSELVIIKKATKAANNFISQHFEFDYDVDLIVTPPSYLMQTIPEDGITGRTYTSRFIIIVLDKSQAPITEDGIFETICHEMSHSLRWEKLPEFASTLFQGMILEGLAIALEEKAMNDTRRSSKQFFLKTIVDTGTKEIEHLISYLQKDFQKNDYDYETVFYTGNDSLPRWAGYRLGYYYVMKYLENTNKSIDEVTLTRYSNFKY